MAKASCFGHCIFWTEDDLLVGSGGLDQEIFDLIEVVLGLLAFADNLGFEFGVNEAVGCASEWPELQLFDHAGNQFSDFGVVGSQYAAVHDAA